MPAALDMDIDPVLPMKFAAGVETVALGTRVIKRDARGEGGSVR
jgi:hypothetical protein